MKGAYNMDNKKIIEELLSFPHQTEWIEFKTNYWDFKGIGEYISALSNSAAVLGKKQGYLVWGIDNDNHEVLGTNIDYNKDINNEPYQHYLARNLSPSIVFSFEDVIYDGKRLVLLTVPAANNVPTEFERERFIRIGSSKENLRKYPQREASLWNVLSNGIPSITNTDSERQELTFEKLFMYYAIKGKKLENKNFKKNLNLINEKTGKYNILALLLSDDNAISSRVSIFNGTRKSEGLKSIKEFGNSCLLYALDSIANYGKDVLNVPLTNETGRVLERNDKFLFDNDSFREAIINAFVHNNWMHLNSPQISVYSDRIEILSHGVLGSDQTYEGFFNCESKPVNPALAHVLMQLEISDRSGKGVPTIIDRYGKMAYTFGEDSILLTIPFEKIVNNRITDKERILSHIKANSNITAKELSEALKISVPMVTKHIRELKENKKIIRIGSNKNGYWKVI